MTSQYLRVALHLGAAIGLGVAVGAVLKPKHAMAQQWEAQVGPVHLNLAVAAVVAVGAWYGLPRAVPSVFRAHLMGDALQYESMAADLVPEQYASPSIGMDALRASTYGDLI